MEHATLKYPSPDLNKSFFSFPIFRFLIGFFLILSSRVGLSKASFCEIHDPWPATGIGLVEFKRQISPSNCTRDAKNFAGCIFALQNFSLYSRSPARVGFFSDEDMEIKKNEILRLIKKMGSYSLVELKPYNGPYNLWTGNPNPFAHLFSKDKKVTREEYYRIRNEAILSNFNHIVERFSPEKDSDSFKIDFNKVIDEISARIPKTKIPRAVADSINQSLKVRADAHTHLVPGGDDKSQKTQTEKTLVGIGIDFLGKDTDEIDELSYGISNFKKQIVGFHLDTDGYYPAEASGLKIGDYLVAINGNDIRNKRTCEILDLIRGPENHPIHITVERYGAGIITRQLNRKKFMMDNIQTRLVEYEGKSFIYLKIKSFSEKGLFRRVYQKLASFDHEKISGVILDLRGNRGGLEREAILLASLFIGQDKPSLGVLNIDKKGHLEKNQIKYRSARTVIQETINAISKEKDLLKNRSEGEFDLQAMAKLGQQKSELEKKEEELEELIKSTSSSFFYHKPAVVLIDAGSESSAEIVVGALRDHGVGVLVGETTFGKGSVQEKKPYQIKTSSLIEGGENSTNAFYLLKTIQIFYQPNGTTNQRVGIAADFEVPSRPDVRPEDEWRPRELDREPFAFQAPVLGRAPSPLKKEIENVRGCVSEEVIKSHFQKVMIDQSNFGENDYRLVYAKEVLKCFVNLKGVHFD